MTSIPGGSRWLLRRIKFVAGIAFALSIATAPQAFADGSQELLIKLKGKAAESKLVSAS